MGMPTLSRSFTTSDDSGKAIKALSRETPFAFRLKAKHWGREAQKRELNVIGIETTPGRVGRAAR
jgi:hypothetical protein